jgi:aryl-phospho-beta-D-glucosidase BglC (GH1 family)
MFTKRISRFLFSIGAVCLFAAFTHCAFGQRAVVSLPSLDSTNGTSAWLYSDPTLVKYVSQPGEEPYLAVSNPSSLNKPAVSAALDLPLDKVRGCLVFVSVFVRVSNVSEPAQSYLGVKAMVHVASPSNADTWDQAPGNGNGVYPLTYDWTKESFQTSVPEDAANANLSLGLQGSTGEADFRDLIVSVIRPQMSKVVRTGPVFTGHGPGSLRGCMISTDIQPSDVATLARWHVNLVRWQINDSHFPHPLADTEDAAAFDAWLNKDLAHLDQLLPYFKAAGILVALDLHTSPGGDNASAVNRIFVDQLWEQHFIDVWEMMAKRYKNERQIWGYDLVNEPITPGIGNGVIGWHDLAEKTARAVRKIDPFHAIIIEPDPGGGVAKLAYLQPIDVPGVVYEVHMYDPSQFTFQGVNGSDPKAVTYPGVIGGQKWDVDRIRREFQPVVDFAKNNNVHIYVGEFSTARWTPGGDKWLADVISVLEENHWDWTYHAFREWQGWSAEIGEDPAVITPSPTPTARLLVLQAAYSKDKPETVRTVAPPK